ncbi:MAG: cupredoxin domain-containing protein [Thermomicrobiales bacterium]
MQKAFRLLLGLALGMVSLLAISTSAIPVAAHDHGTPVPTETSLVVPLGQLNDSGITGTATLDEANGKTTVTVDVTNAPSGVAMPSHIHVGTCDTLDPVPTFPLNDVVEGHAVTVIDTTIAHLLASPFAVNLHKSAEEITVYVACGNITSTSATPVAQAGAEKVDIQISDFSFTPASIEVKAGTSMTFTNGGVDHTATSNDAPEPFNSGILHKGQSFTVVLNTPGTYNYLCLLHPTMIGTIVVK